MTSLASWSGWRMAAAWTVWLLFVILALVTTLAVLLWRARQLESTDATRAPGGGFDFAISFVPSQLRWVAFAILAPPVVLTAFWLWRRFGVR